jgi:transposase-like protein
MEKCPYCQASEQQVKNGRNPSGSQRYKCRVCGRIYTLEPTPAAYDQATRAQAVRLYLEGMNLRRIARILGVNHQSVANWVNAHALRLPNAPVPERVDTAELDELFTFVEQKKTAPTS